MTAYLIVRVTITDPEQYQNYMALSPKALDANGGRFIARGGPTEVLEGEPENRRVVVVEFPSMEAAKAFYDSPEYLEARAAREGAAEMHILLVDGV